MKKRLLVTAAVCALSAACIFGATACDNADGGKNGGNSENGGNGSALDVVSVQVTEEQWKAAVDKAITANLTCYVEADFGGSYNYKLTYYQFGNESYSSYIHNNGAESHQEDVYELIEASKTYSCTNDSGEWGVDGDHLYGPMDMLENFRDSYSEFTFKDGEYQMTMSEEGMQMNCEVKINSDGYFCYINAESLIEMLGAKHTELITYTFYNFGTTTYEVPAEAKKAIADYKAAHSNN